MKRLAMVAGQRLRVARESGESAAVRRLEEELREAFVRWDMRAVRAISEQLHILRPRAPLTPQERDALMEKVRRLLAEAEARA